MIDTRLKVFRSVATLLSFTKAANELFISQPAISKHIQELEKEYGVQLFDRIGNRIQLTRAGQLMLDHACKIIDAYQNLDFDMKKLTEKSGGELRIGASTTISQYVLPELIAEFRKHYPDIRLTLLSGNSHEIEDALAAGRIDLGMVEGIIIGMLYANSLRNNLPDTWVPGIKFCSKRILRTGIILYGFKLTFQDVMAVGVSAIVMDAIIVCGTIGLGILVGRLLKIDRSIALLTACGSAICGAAAVLGVDGAIRPKPYKTAVAVATVVIFGTLSMFLYPILYRAGIFDLSPDMMGLFTGSTVHEVAHVVGAANAMGAEVSNNAIIVKMIRVMMLVPVLLVIAWTVARDVAKRDCLENTDTNKPKISIPWFAILFLVVIGFNSLGLLPESIVDWINQLDTFLLTMAMAALGAETSFDKFKKAGIKPFLLAAILYCWLIGGGYCLVKFAIPYLQ